MYQYMAFGLYTHSCRAAANMLLETFPRVSISSSLLPAVYSVMRTESIVAGVIYLQEASQHS